MRQISASGDASIGTLVARAVERVSKEGAISIEDRLTAVFRRRAPQCCARRARVLLCDMNISSIAQLLPVLEAVMATGKPLFAIANEKFYLRRERQDRERPCRAYRGDGLLLADRSHTRNRDA
jgi:chaperonin GroEL (HSP60 family)